MNNVRLGLPRLLAWLKATKPGAVALQEVKTTTAQFPAVELAAAGYGSLAVGQKTWNGGALLARGSDPVTNRRSLSGDAGDAGDVQARCVEAAIKGIIAAGLYLSNGNSKAFRIELEVGSIALLQHQPHSASACFVFAHGAGAGMQHHYMEAVATGLAERGIAILRYQFPYMEAGSKRPDSPAVAHAAVRAAVATAIDLTGLPAVAGGKSFGGRMTSQAQSRSAMDGVQGPEVVKAVVAARV